MSRWNDPETAPEWIEVVVKYDGPRATKAQPSCVGTGVKVNGKWVKELGTFPTHRKVIGWLPLPE